MARARTRWVSVSAALAAALLQHSRIFAQPAPLPAEPAPGAQPAAPLPPAAEPIPPAGSDAQTPPGTQPPVWAPAPGPELPPPAAQAPAFDAAPPVVDVQVAPTPLPEVAPEAAPEEDGAWYDSFELSAFADVYAGVDYNFPKAQQPNPIRAYDVAQGFALAWVGLDVWRAADPVGGAVSLRFGPEAERLAAACIDGDGDCDSDIGLSLVKQAFVSWRPGGATAPVTLDLGKFDTPFGAEVAESQGNINYTRGALYWLGQPAYHTGLRVGADLDRHFNLRFLAVNGWNRSLDNNAGKSLGLQATLRIPRAEGVDEDALTIAVGYLGGPEHDDFALVSCPPGQRFDVAANPSTGCVDSAGSPGGEGLVDRGNANTKGLRHFLDLTTVAAPTPELRLLLNGSLGIDNQRSLADVSTFESVLWYGVMLGGRYAVTDAFGVAARGEYYGDPDGYTTGAGAANDVRLVTGTLTADYSPAHFMVLKLDARLDWSNKRIFPDGLREVAGSSFSTTLGAVFKTN